MYSYPGENRDGAYGPIVAAFMARIMKLHRYGAIPFIVFDGAHLDGKQSDASCAKSRADALTQLDEAYVAAVRRLVLVFMRFSVSHARRRPFYFPLWYQTTCSLV